MAVDVLDNAVAIQLVPQLAADYLAGDGAATSSFRLVMALVDAVRLGGHLVGGLWVVGASAVLLRSGVLRPVIGWIGVGVGAVLAANPFVPALLNVSFMTLPLWLVAFGVAIARIPDGTVGASSAAIPLAAGARP
jgi:hypothetical protein